MFFDETKFDSSEFVEPFETMTDEDTKDFVSYYKKGSLLPKNLTDVCSVTDYGQNLKMWRESMEYTGKKLADRAGITPAALSQIENGDRANIDDQLFWKFVDALMCSPDNLLGRAICYRAVWRPAGLDRKPFEHELKVPLVPDNSTKDHFTNKRQDLCDSLTMTAKRYPELCTVLHRLTETQNPVILSRLYDTIAGVFKEELKRIP